MQFLNDDMDDLFRNAADHYPLKTDGGDWNTVMTKLQAAEALPPAGIHRPGGKYYRLLWLLLLTPLFFIAHLPRMAQQQQAGVINATDRSQQRVSTPELATAAPEKKSVAGATITQIHPYTINKQSWQPPATEIAQQQGNSVEKQYTKKTKPEQGGLSDTTSFWLKSDNTVNAIAGPDAMSDRAAVTRVVAEDTGRAAGAGMDTLPAVTTDSSVAAELVIKKPAKGRDQIKGLYFGVVASPDISTVKGQRVARTGYGAGMIIGYRISKRVAVETGLFWDRKYYYSEGEYFDTKKLPYQPTWKIKDVNGWCRMFEVPLNVRYFFAGGKKNSWYASAGVSSYIMNRENYDYSYDWNNVTRTINRSYDNATRNWLNIMHIGIGLERPAGVLGTLRVEPYLKASIGGVGIGSLPLTSFGVNIGITRTLRF